MKVILNKDLATLGEEGDVKDVAKGYFRNYLFPRGIALPYTPQTVKMFEARKDAIDEKKAQKRQDAMGLKEKLESVELSISMPAGANGRLYGAVTTQTVAEELAKQGFQIDRKRIDLAGTGIKIVGKYKATIRLYENSQAEIQITVVGQEVRTETPQAPARPARRRRDAVETPASGEAPASVDTEASIDASANAGSEAAPAETSPEPAAAPSAESEEQE
jgi:large subunit ribosomal protein L9